ncbi:hypothetical protein GG344DRAFT_86910 [Lentinula edodes]|nr:hypothetical protein GG344DRAFT_86910 [Lentinula edodes]
MSIPAPESVNLSLDTPPTTLSRPFPPPSLAGVPFDYILEQLRDLAPSYWGNSESSDCTLVIPVPYSRVRLTTTSPSLSTTPARPSYDPSGLGRRATEPSTLALLPRISLKLHSEYLSAHSSFLRSLFSGASTVDLINSAPRRFTIPADRLPRLLNSSAAHPVLFLPVPDPSSIDLVFHWMYFGDLRYIRDSLHEKHIQWEGIARNVEYLGLSHELKVFLGDWYARWLHPDRSRSCDDLTSLKYNSDPDSDSDSFAETLVSDIADDMDCLDIKCDFDAKHEEPGRGRDRGTRDEQELCQDQSAGSVHLSFFVCQV